MNSGEHRKSERISMKIKLIISSFLLVVLALGFNALLSRTSLEKLYVGSIVSQYREIGKYLQRDIEKSIRFGKKIDKFIGMDTMLDETKQNLMDKVRVLNDSKHSDSENYNIAISVVLLSDGIILYSTDEKLIGTLCPVKLLDDVQKKSEEYIRFEKRLYIPLPVIEDATKNKIATIFFSFDEKQVNDLFDKIDRNNLIVISGILICCILSLILFLHYIIPSGADSEDYPRLKISAVMILVIGVSQIVFACINSYDYKEYYLTMTRQKVKTLTSLLKKDIEYLLDKKIQINKLLKIDALMGEIIQASPEIRDIVILDKHNKPLYMANQSGNIDFSKSDHSYTLSDRETTEPEYRLSVNLMKKGETEDKEPAGYISTNLSEKFISSKLRNSAMDSLTVVVISFLFFFEMLILIFQMLRSQPDTSVTEKTTHYSAIRPAAFTFLFATYIASSFLPMYSGELYRNSQPLWGLSEKVIMGLPISSEMFFVGLAIIWAGSIIDKKGWHVACFIGIVISAVGSVLSGIPNNIVEFIIYRGVIGFGYGLTWLSFQGYVVSCTDTSERSKGIANLVAGIFSGSICGGATGGMLAERLGYRPVFFAGAGIIILSAILIVIFLRNSFTKPQHSAVERQKSFNLSVLFRFIFNRNIFFILLCCSIPNAICIVGILYYFTPIYLNSMNISSSNIARSLMLYGLVMIYIAPALSRFIDRSERKISYIFFSSFIGGAGLLLFYLMDGLWATIAAILMLSISNSIGNTTRLVFALNTDIVKEIGHGKALGIYQFLERIGQVIGPLSIGLAVSLTDMKTGIIFIGAFYLLLALFFFFGAKSESITLTNRR